jgi:hypothetical protein
LFSSVKLSEPNNKVSIEITVYGVILINNCILAFVANKLEQLQLEAARIITGLPKFASKESVYFETGWETLSCRRRRRKLTLFHKIHNNIAPRRKNDLENISRRHLGILYFKKILRL